MIFNAAHQAMHFELAGMIYEVPKGCDVEIPDRIAYCVKANGLPLEKGAKGGAVVQGRPKVHAKRVGPWDPQPSVDELREALADETGEDESLGDDDGIDDSSDGIKAAEKTFQEMKRRGMAVPGRPPGRPRKG